MEKFVNKVAIVTGSSSGIGAAICKELVKYINVVGLARRLDRLKELADELNDGKNAGKFYPVKCDLTKESEIENAFEWITSSKLGSIAVLVNNAGILKPSLLSDATGDDISQIFDTNVKASILCSKLAVQHMTSNSVQGHVININSIAGHSIMNYNPNIFQIYSASKHSLKVFSEALRRELVNKESDIKVTNLSPGSVITEIVRELYFAEKQPSPKRILQPKDIADACVYVLSTPNNVLISELTIMPIHQEV